MKWHLFLASHTPEAADVNTCSPSLMVALENVTCLEMTFSCLFFLPVGKLYVQDFVGT